MSAFTSVAQGSTEVVMPWGKHKGRPLAEVPVDYLRWALANASMMRDELRAAIEGQLGKPTKGTQPAGDAPIDEADVESVQGQLLAARRRIADLEGQLKQARAAVEAAGKVRLGDTGEFRRLLKQWFGSWSRQYHPDMGGSAEKQIMVNVLYRDLMRRLDECG